MVAEGACYPPSRLLYPLTPIWGRVASLLLSLGPLLGLLCGAVSLLGLPGSIHGPFAEPMGSAVGHASAQDARTDQTETVALLP